MSSKRLLEQSKVFCMAPWTHLHVLTDGKVFPCCVSGYEDEHAVGDLQAGDSLEAAWNSPRMRALRRNMLAERRSELCSRCYLNEDLGLDSFRTTANRDKAHHVAWVERTDADGRLDELHLPYLDLRISNFCNLRCRICAHKYSSSWHRDSVRLGLVDAATPRSIAAFGSSEALWSELRPLLPTLEHVHFAGGEPLLMVEQYRLVRELLALGRTGVRLSYNTNFSFLRFKEHDAVSLWQQFDDVYVSASLDGMGARGEYLRKGQKWEWVEANRERLMRECPHVDFQIAATVSISNVLHMPDFFRAWHERGWVALDRWRMSLLFDPDYYDVRGLPPDLKRRVEDRYGELIEGYLRPLGEAANEVIRNFEAIVRYMNECDLDVAEEFRRATKELDLLRHESFAETFPELAAFVAPTAADDLVVSARARRKLGDAPGALRDYDAAVACDPGHVRALVERGLQKRASADSPGALADFEGALALDPDQPRVRLQRAVILRELGEDAQALAELEAVLAGRDALDADAHEEVRAHVERALIRQRRSELAAALGDYDRALALAPHSLPLRAEILLERGAVRFALGDGEGALWDHDEAVLARPQRAEARLRRGLLKQQLGDPAGALADFDAALALDPGLVRARLQRGVLLREQNQDEAALAEFQRVLEQLDQLSGEDSLRALSERGRIRRKCGDLAGARAEYGRALAQAPESFAIRAELLGERAELLRALGDAAGALRDHDEAVRCRPQSSRAWLRRGSTRRELGDAAGALEDLTAALALPPEAEADHLEARLYRALLLRPAGRTEEALADLECVLAHPERLPRECDLVMLAHLERARIRRGKGLGREALEDYACAFERAGPGYRPLILTERGDLKRGLGDAVGSLHDLTQAVALLPETSLAFLERALVAMDGGDVSFPFHAMASLDPSDPGTPSFLHYARAVARRQLGAWPEALRDFERALELLPGSDAPLVRFINWLRQPDQDPLGPVSPELRAR